MRLGLDLEERSILLKQHVAASWQNRPARFVAIGFGAGAIPVAPGTCGSLAGMMIGAILCRIAPWLLPLGVAACVAAGLWAIPAATGLALRKSVKEADEDAGWIVIDEIAGQMLAMIGLHHISGAGLAAAFMLFRLFDIAKPGPIGWVDRQGGAAGIMADDLLAGVASLAVLLVVQAVAPGLLA